MATKGGQSHAKRARELELKERRERKKAKKEARLAGETPTDEVDEESEVDGEPEVDAEPEVATEWIQ